MSLVYVDTSVLVKRYLPTPASAAVDELFEQPEYRFALSELSLVEVESVLMRRAREPGGEGLNVPGMRMRFESDLRVGFFDLHGLSLEVLLKARQLIADGVTALATLDALHLGTALGITADTLATDDRQLMRAARARGLNVISFV